MLKISKINFAMVLLLLWGVFFLKIGIIALGSLGLCFILFLFFFTKKAVIAKAGMIVLINFAYWFFSAFLVNSIQPSTFLNTDFYGGDGRVFLFYLPLLYFSVVSASEREIDFVIRNISWIAYAAIGLFLVWLVAPISILAGGHARIFFGLLTSHTGAGIFFGFVSVFLIILGMEGKDRYKLYLGFAMVLVVFATASRQGLLSVCVVLAWYLLKRVSFKVLVRIAGLLLLPLLLLPYLAPHTYEKLTILFSSEMLASIREQLLVSDWEPGAKRELVEGEYNILSRILFWIYAVKCFFISPILGIGFGRFNDHNVSYEGIKGIASFATGGEQVYSVFSAHNSYLHLLSESGILGLFLLLFFWYYLFMRFRTAEFFFNNNVKIRSYFLACRALIIFTLFGALFGHGLASPSIGIPVLTVAGVGIAFLNKFKQITPRIAPAGCCK